jgi:Mg2+ and Co2+ transporter CorA
VADAQSSASSSGRHHHPVQKLCEVDAIAGIVDDVFGSTDPFDGSDDVIVSAIVFADWIVTIHQAPFVGLDELVMRIKSTFGLEKSLRILGGPPRHLASVGRAHGGGVPTASATFIPPAVQSMDHVQSYVADQVAGLQTASADAHHGTLGGPQQPEAAAAPSTTADAPLHGPAAEAMSRVFGKRRRRLAAQQRLWHQRRNGGIDIPLLLTGWTFATLVEFVTESYLPDPIAVLAEADSVDEMVLFVGGSTDGPYRGDQADLLLRIAMLRRKISTLRAALYQKEQFVQQMMMPAIRTTFVSRSSVVIDIYRHITAQTGHVAERLDAARDVLNQANNNFISQITMHMSHASSRTNLKMQMLTQVSTMFLPLNLVAGLFGMNVQIPFQNDSHPTLTAFYVIIGCMGAWLLLTSTSLLMTLRELRTASKASEEAAREHQRAIDAPD